jgi:fucose permease
MVLHVLIWKIDDMVANSVVVSLLGLFVGPTFPLVLDIATNQNTKQALGVSILFM